MKTNYNQTMINLFCKKFKNNCIYIPFNSQIFLTSLTKQVLDLIDLWMFQQIKRYTSKIKIIVLSYNQFL